MRRTVDTDHLSDCESSVSSDEPTPSVEKRIPCALPFLDWRSAEARARYFKQGTRAIASILFFGVGGYMCIFMITTVLDDLPNLDVYGVPLRDMILDHIDGDRWYLYIDEAVITIMSVLHMTLVLFHKHHYVVTRRFFLSAALIYAMRSLVISTTRLPVPNPEWAREFCYTQPKTQGFLDRLGRAAGMTTGIGLWASGSVLCGDLIFSGHTTACTLLLLQLWRYCPTTRGWRIFKVAVLVPYLIGIACIFLSEIHYTVDVVLAWLLSFLVYEYVHYHAFRRTVTLQTGREWPPGLINVIPFFNWFESDDFFVVNEFESPLKMIPWVLSRSPSKTAEQDDEMIMMSD